MSWSPLCMLHSYIDTAHHYIITAYSWTTATRICYYTATWLGYTQLLHVLIQLDPAAYMHCMSMYSCLHWSWFILVLHGYAWIPVIWNTVSVTCIIVSCYWYGYSRYWTWELLICDMWNPTSIVPVSRYIVPVSRYIVLCYQQSSGPVIMLPVSCTVFVLVTLYTWHIRS